MSDSKFDTTDDRHTCDYPVCSVRGAGHPLACNCRSGEPQTTADNCPFCGSGAELKQITDEDAGENFGGYYVECRVCRCTTDLMFSCGKDARPLVLEKWNRRVCK